MKSQQLISLLLHATYCVSLALPANLQAPLGLLSDFQTDQDYIDIETKSAQWKPRRIAIIGSGITGATAAFTIAEAGRLDPDGPPSITLFERNPIIGGRITTTQVYGDPRFTIDTCAATFSTLSDTCLATSASNVGLLSRLVTPSDAGTGVWDGAEFRGFVEDTDFRNPQSWSLFRKLRWFRRYGITPWEYARNVSLTQTRYRQLGTAIFKSLEAAVKAADLEKAVRLGLCESGLFDCTQSGNSLFLQEVIDAGIRERFFGNVDELNGLDAILGFSGDTLSEVVGGNLRLVDRLIKLSGADLRLSTTVAKLIKQPQGVWRLYFSTPTVSDSMDFDAVVIAAPLSTSDLAFEPEVSSRPGLLLPYVDSFVTHFTTTSNLSSTYFNVDGPVPQSILTTGVVADRSPPFFQLRLIGQYSNPKTLEAENLYKLVSERPITDDELGEYLELDVGPPTKPVISWINREPLFDSVPRLDANQTLLGDVEVEPGLFYAGAGEQVTATWDPQ
ncbi:hypothetical protein H2199_005556 [Coniosporium tulheliwenetii]|uniref:Uncharacterized protein n=1 Tax=Coniosporium tulheliwenetii TaxID=3383036 RepID=A0ACC2YZZ2_9PEZI|nr:hypothetical protein H2199_005556 [Cladosporium sp. JES 115]